MRAGTTKTKGFTLIELMIAMLASAIVLVGVMAFGGITSSTNDQFSRSVKIQQSLEGAMATLGRDIRMAGYGFKPLCDELRVYGRSANEFVNPTSGWLPNYPGARDGDTGEYYWVLRDGIQAHWRSSEANGGGNQMLGDPDRPTSAAPQNIADSFDVAYGEPGFAGATGGFRLAKALSETQGYLDVEAAPEGSENALDRDRRNASLKG